MKTLKKIVSLSLVMTMIITTLLTNCAFAAIEFSDVNETTAYSEAIYNLVEDGVLNGYDNEDGTKSFKPEAGITRAEFAKVIVVAKFGANVLADATSSKFNDMEGHWSTKYVEYASGSGIINGYEDGSFKPEKSVTYAEAVKMIVCALGYGPVVDTTLTPWYQGYLNVANSIGLTKGAVAMGDLPAVRGLVAQLIDNMGDCKNLVQGAIGADGSVGYVQSGTGSNDSVVGPEVFEKTGVLIGIYDNSLKGNDTALNMGRVNIDETIYELDPSINYLDLKDLIGHAVIFEYYAKSALTYVKSIKSANRTNVYTIADGSLIDNFDGSKIYYFENENDYDTKYYNIDSDVYVVYNGYGVDKASINASSLATWLTMDTGSVTLYNNDKDSDIDVIFIDKYETYYALAPVTIKGQTTIKDKFDQTRTFTANEDDVIVTKVTGEGGAEAACKLSSFSAGNVISIARPLSSTAKTIVKISSATASGVISTMGTNYEDVKIGNKAYKFTRYFRDLEASDPAKYGFDMGANVKFYLDYTGRVVYAEVTVSEVPYGYLIDYVINNGIESDEITLRYIDKSGKVATTNLKSKLRVNGVMRDASDAIDDLADSSLRIHGNKATGYEAAPAKPGLSPVSQVIKYKLGTENGNAVIDEIFTVSATNATSQAAEDGGIIPEWTNTDSAEAPFITCNTKLTCSGSSTTKQFKNASGNIEFAVGSKTVVFRVPLTKIADEYRRSTGSGSFSDKSNYFVEAYDVDGTTAQVVVYYLTGSGGSKVYATTSTYMVVNITTTTNDGKTVHELEYAKFGDNIYDPADGTTKVTKKVFAEDTNQLAGLKKGDVIRFVTSSGEIEVVEKLFIFDGKKLYGKNGDDGAIGEETDNYFNHKKGSDAEYYQARYGKAYEVSVDYTNKGSIAIYTEGSQTGYDQIFNITADTKFYTLDDRGNVVDAGYSSITEGSKSDYASASDVLVVSYDEKVAGIYIIPAQQQQ